MKVSLTGIKPTGIPHIGNYLGAIKPALEFAKMGTYTPFYFIANYHALTTVKNKKELEDMTYLHAATWLAFGADDLGVVLYLQSDIPEIFEINWILSCQTSKGLLDRAHAYKAILEKGAKKVSHGLYSYPVLMSADILSFDTDIVPVGRDQKQHVEIARDIAGAFNKTYGNTFKVPEVFIKDSVATIDGIDGQKMSKSYGNVIPLFAENDVLKKRVYKIKTDIKTVEEPKDPDTSIIYNMYKHFASEQDIQNLRERYLKGGLSWKDAKDSLYDALIEYFKEPQNKFNELINDRAYIREVLNKNRTIARERSSLVLKRVKEAIGSFCY